MIGRIFFRGLFVLVGLLAWMGLAVAAPLILSEKFPPNDPVTALPTQPESFYLLVDGVRRECEAIKVKTTGTVQASCDIEDLTDGVYTVVLVAVKSSNDTETPSKKLKLSISLKFGGRTYQNQRLYNTSYSLVPL